MSRALQNEATPHVSFAELQSPVMMSEPRNNSRKEKSPVIIPDGTAMTTAKKTATIPIIE